MAPVTLAPDQAGTAMPPVGGAVLVDEVGGQVRVTTEAIEQHAESVRGFDFEQLPMFEGYRFPAAAISFGGTLEFDIAKASDRALIDALRLGRRVVVRVFIEDDLRVAVDAEVTARSFAFKGKDATPTTTAKLSIDGRRDEEE